MTDSERGGSATYVRADMIVSVYHMPGFYRPQVFATVGVFLLVGSGYSRSRSWETIPAPHVGHRHMDSGSDLPRPSLSVASGLRLSARG